MRALLSPRYPTWRGQAHNSTTSKAGAHHGRCQVQTHAYAAAQPSVGAYYGSDEVRSAEGFFWPVSWLAHKRSPPADTSNENHRVVLLWASASIPARAVGCEASSVSRRSSQAVHAASMAPYTHVVHTAAVIHCITQDSVLCNTMHVACGHNSHTCLVVALLDMNGSAPAVRMALMSILLLQSCLHLCCCFCVTLAAFSAL